jgi:hypothetical protein
MYDTFKINTLKKKKKMSTTGSRVALVTTKQQHEPLNVESDHVKVRQTQAAFDPRISNTNPTN